MTPAPQSPGDQAEAFAAQILTLRGYGVQNLNETRRNHPFVDLRCLGAGGSFDVSVKSAWSANREVRLGAPHILRQVSDTVFLMILMSAHKGQPMTLTPGGYALWIVLARVAKDEALAAHNHYAAHHPGSTGHSVMIKDKLDSNPTTRSGAVFQSWQQRFLDAWHLLPKAPTP